MKKLLVIAVVAATFASCSNNETKVEEVTADTTAVIAAPDTTVVVADTTMTAPVDTTQK